ncbi:DUF1622 domain-containing protein [Desulfobulbus alkaliphilus]|uniref:DUF1622 domain-containing protein n=1 Tax=Desulfobulbus alkaliphilus TaxID=869814 RepID=UPI001964080E|nr:DUF1622 domain-containing protein [Desulfobulbus alkaliphilus]MBM9536526.1 DUF1622 domain-containing protein [Desulfobulbus alkaliphilus]
MTGPMMALVQEVAEWSIALLELMGIGTILLFSLYATVTNVYLLVTKGFQKDLFQAYRLQLARGILLGLEFLVAADIIKTVAIEMSFTNVGILAVIVLIRTFLSFAIELEMTNMWPWQKPPDSRFRKSIQHGGTPPGEQDLQ